MYSLVASRPTGYLIKYNLFTTISELSDLYTNSVTILYFKKQLSRLYREFDDNIRVE